MTDADGRQRNTPLLDPNAESIQVGDDGMVRVDGIIAFRVVRRQGMLCAQFCDQDRMRSSCRGTRYVEIPLEVLADKLNGGA